MKTMFSKRMSTGFAERVMMAITAINGCRYCSWVHTRMGQHSGSSSKDILEIYSMNFKNVDKGERVALTFAQHYAETDRQPTEESVRKLVSTYGAKKSQDILNYINMIYLANLVGNTIDSFKSRMKGKPPEDGSLIFEYILYSFGFVPMKILSMLGTA